MCHAADAGLLARDEHWSRGRGRICPIGFEPRPPRYRPRLFLHTPTPGAAFALRRLCGVFTGRLRPISGGLVRETVNVPLTSAGLNFIVGLDPPISFLGDDPPLCTTPTAKPAGAIEGRPPPPPDVAADPKPGMIAKIRGPISVKDHSFAVYARSLLGGTLDLGKSRTLLIPPSWSFRRFSFLYSADRRGREIPRNTDGEQGQGLFVSPNFYAPSQHVVSACAPRRPKEATIPAPRERSMQDVASELRRKPLPETVWKLRKGCILRSHEPAKRGAGLSFRRLALPKTARANPVVSREVCKSKGR
jgi:hypothetical protein